MNHADASLEYAETGIQNARRRKTASIEVPANRYESIVTGSYVV
jgi:hypothetical protein